MEIIGLIVITYLIIIFVNSFRSPYKKRSKGSSYNNNYYKNNTNDEDNLRTNTYDQLWDKYKAETKTPPLNALVSRAYENGEIFSGRNNFDDLNQEDKKTILRIAICISKKKAAEKALEKMMDMNQSGGY
ncbi:hypothetical protein [Candidatus Vampirococcus lugosii]|uniref:Uncharacterized protein n=1 Tax=Candidatus Vampirococcus lugosii TaxID=2789015 RepID=A0ABS5QMB8_9BACT|nr:hypothetical protein [Candidatus Vampirococcus lugosii]MBS8122283.1 hypothetical protein [Candidatus Vampirococcus lugosii]